MSTIEKRRRVGYANVMATLAFFFALTGSATAVGKYLTAGSPITSGDLAGSTYGNPVIADGAITTAKFDGSATAPNAAKLAGLDVVPGICLAGICRVGPRVSPGEHNTLYVACPPNRVLVTTLFSAPQIHVLATRALSDNSVELSVVNQGELVDSYTFTPLCLGSG
jgi:hypothetical protein